ncbi:MAG: DUF3363 domain-containing protein [Gammaproteobacteria bacterium]|nr:DUF3363 domain-containing protein [Gammaproteobacteria bacterium]
MPKKSDPLDELPILDPGSKRVQSEPAPPLRTFKRAIAKATRLRGQSGRQPARGGGARGGHPNRGGQAAAVRPSRPDSRRVLVKARYVKQTSARGAKAARLHLKYVERDGVDQDGGKGVLYNGQAAELSADNFLERSSDDPHQFRFIVSPEDAAELDLTAYTRDLMRQVETDLGRELDWIAVNHYNTDNPHTHIVIRGRGLDGKELRMDREFISSGIRSRARELATRELGPRLEHEIEQALAKELGQERYTSLDWQIDQVSHENIVGEGGVTTHRVDLGGPGERVPSSRDRFVVGRLNALKEMGLARQGSHARCYELQADWKAQLKSLGERGDIYKRLARVSREARERRIFDPKTEAGDVVGRVSGKGSHDELYDRYYAVVEDASGAARYVHLPASVDVSELPEGGIVRVRSLADPWRKTADAVIEEYAGRHGGVYDGKGHAEELAASERFMARGVDPEDYALAHTRRAKRLARFGLVDAKGQDVFAVPGDLAARQTTLERDNPNPRAVRIEVLDTRHLEQQVSAQGPSWLDLQQAGAEVARNGFGEALSSALTRRAGFLRTLDIEAGDPRKLQKLERLERLALGNEYADRSGKTPRPLKAKDRLTGVLKSKMVAPSGKAFGVFETGGEFSLVPWRDRWQQHVGRQMAFGLDEKGVPFGRVLGRGMNR